MHRISLVLVWCVSILIFLSSCGRNTKLIILDYTEQGIDFQYIFDNYITEAFPNFLIEYSKASGEKTRRVPDIYIMNHLVVRNMAESGSLLDISDIYNKYKHEIINFPAEAGSIDDFVYAVSWSVNPGAVFYRRSLARKYLGTENPDAIKGYFQNFNVFLNTARILKTRSKGSCVTVASIDELIYPFLSARDFPWIVNNQLIIDPIMDQFFYSAKELYDNEWVMRADDHDIFACFLTARDLNTFSNDIKENNTVGDWAVIPGPSPYFNDGTWIGASRKTKKSNQIKQLIEWLLSNEDFQKQYALDTGEIVSNINVLEYIKNDFFHLTNDSYVNYSDFLGGQNYYKVFVEIAEKVTGRLSQSTDSIINEIFFNELQLFVKGEKSKEDALNDFRSQTETLLLQGN